MTHGLQVPLRPPRALAKEGAQTRQALLLDGRPALGHASPAGLEQPQAEVLVLGEPVAPRSAVVGDRVERGQAVELAVAAHARRAVRRSPRLVEQSVHRELDVLAPGQRARAVVDANEHLETADALVGEVRGRVAWRGRVEPAVRVDDARRRRGRGSSRPSARSRAGRRAVARRRSAPPPSRVARRAGRAAAPASRERRWRPAPAAVPSSSRRRSPARSCSPPRPRRAARRCRAIVTASLSAGTRKTHSRASAPSAVAVRRRVQCSPGQREQESGPYEHRDDDHELGPEERLSPGGKPAKRHRESDHRPTHRSCSSVRSGCVPRSSTGVVNIPNG